MAARRAPRNGPRLYDRAESLRRRASRYVRRGDRRKAIVALREAANLTGDARSWVALGHLLADGKRATQAIEAYRRGLWLHRQAGHEGRARVVAELILRVDPRDPVAARLVDHAAQAA